MPPGGELEEPGVVRARLAATRTRRRTVMFFYTGVVSPGGPLVSTMSPGL